MAKQIKVTFTYEFKKGEEHIADTSELIMPYCDFDRALQHGCDRYLPQVIEKKHKFLAKTIIPCYLDGYEEVKEETEYSFIGKDIATMSWVELQDLAVVKNMIGIPLYKDGSLIQARRKAMELYLISTGVEKKRAKELTGGRGITLPSVKVDGKSNGKVVITKQEEIVEELKKEGWVEPEKGLTFDEMKALADRKEVKYHPNIGEATLKDKLEAEGHI